MLYADIFIPFGEFRLSGNSKQNTLKGFNTSAMGNTRRETLDKNKFRTQKILNASLKSRREV